MRRPISRQGAHLVGALVLGGTFIAALSLRRLASRIRRQRRVPSRLRGSWPDAQSREEPVSRPKARALRRVG